MARLQTMMHNMSVFDNSNTADPENNQRARGLLRPAMSR